MQTRFRYAIEKDIYEISKYFCFMCNWYFEIERIMVVNKETGMAKKKTSKKKKTTTKKAKSSTKKANKKKGKK